MLLNRPDTHVLVSLDEYQLQWVLWLGQGDIQRGIRRAVNYVDDTAYNHPTHPDLRVPGALFDPAVDYIAFYEVNPKAPDDRD